MTRRKEIQAGDTFTLRIKKDTPSYLIDFINKVRDEEGNQGLIRYLELGMQLEKQQRGEGIFIPLPPCLTEKEIEKVTNNEPLLMLLGNIVRSAVSFDHPFSFDFLCTESPSTKQKGEEKLEVSQKDHSFSNSLRRKRKSTFKGKGLTKMKDAFL